MVIFHSCLYVYRRVDVAYPYPPPLALALATIGAVGWAFDDSQLYLHDPVVTRGGAALP